MLGVRGQDFISQWCQIDWNKRNDSQESPEDISRPGLKEMGKQCWQAVEDKAGNSSGQLWKVMRVHKGHRRVDFIQLKGESQGEGGLFNGSQARSWWNRYFSKTHLMMVFKIAWKNMRRFKGKKRGGGEAAIETETGRQVETEKRGDIFLRSGTLRNHLWILTLCPSGSRRCRVSYFGGSSQSSPRGKAS